MPWLAALEPALPAHCEPTSDFLFHLSSTLHTCIPTPLAFLSQLLGTLSIVAWLFAQLPQIYKNYKLSSTSGLSIFFLVEWCLGDLSNLLGAAFTHQASWQVIIGAYYVFVDLCLVGQWIWYERLRHGRMVRRIRRWSGGRDDVWEGGADSGVTEVVIEGLDVSEGRSSLGSTDSADRANGKPQAKTDTKAPISFRSPALRSNPDDEKSSTTPGGTTIYRIGTPSSSIPTPSPRTILLVACLLAMAQAAPLRQEHSVSTEHTRSTAATPLQNAGTALSWMSSVLYLGSRLPQLWKNYRRKSTAGLSPQLFAAAFCGNLFYSSALLTNPCAWASYPPHGGHGWVGPDGSERGKWVAAAFPFWLGAAGVLLLDASVGVQFALYGEGSERLVIAEADDGRAGKSWHWRKVSGWMRGWVPSISEGKEGRQADPLLDGSADARAGYGTVA